MKKISERAVEIMVERYKKLNGPSRDFESYHDYCVRMQLLGYPGVAHVCASDVALALDEYQAEQQGAVTANPRDLGTHDDDWIADAVAGLAILATASEAATALRTSQRNLRRMIADGRIRAVRQRATGSSRTLISRAEIVRYLRGLMRMRET